MFHSDSYFVSFTLIKRYGEQNDDLKWHNNEIVFNAIGMQRVEISSCASTNERDDDLTLIFC